MSETKQGNKSGKLLQILAGIEDGTVGTALAAAMRTDQAQGEFLTELYEVSNTEDPALLEEMVKKHFAEVLLGSMPGASFDYRENLATLLVLRLFRVEPFRLLRQFMAARADFIQKRAQLRSIDPEGFDRHFGGRKAKGSPA